MKQNRKAFTRAPIHLRRMVRGFTLIELLVVIAIIGILAAITVVSVQGPRNKARDTEALANLRQVASVLEQYYGDNGTYPQNITDWGDLGTAVENYGTPLPGPYSVSTDETGTAYCIWTSALNTGSGAYVRCKNGATCGQMDITDAVSATNCG